MRNLNEITWSKFHIEELFNIVGTITTHPSVLKKGGKTPRITCAATQNGLDSFFKNQPTEEGNVLTADSATVGFIGYQEHPFIATDHVEKLVFTGNANFNRYIALFIKLCIDKAKASKFGYGYKFSQTRIKRQTIMLPVTSDGKPDYAYMEEYMKSVENRLLERYKTYLTDNFNQTLTGGGKIKSIKWEPFFMEDIFNIYSSVRLTNADKTRGNRPFIGATDSNNGITSFVGNINSSLDDNVLGVNYNGSVVENFYHPYKAIFSDDVKRLHTKDINGNKYVYLFLKNAILKQKVKFEYGYKFNGERMSRTKIMLPTDDKGQPYYSYMEEYMRLKERELLLNYIDLKLQ